MRRSVLVAALAAALVGVPAIPAYAAPEHCSEEVRAVRGTQPTLAQVDTWLTAAAAEHGVPVALLRVIAYKESTWRQFAADGSPLISTDGVCGLGLMQVTADGREDDVELASDGAYNASVGAGILKEKWLFSQQTPPPSGYAPDDPDVLENWYYALCLYNGCSGDDAYAADAAKYLHDPFRYLPSAFRTYIRPAGFTRPSEAKPSYVFPSAFQARATAGGGEFVFYDHTTGTVTDVVAARTHRVSSPPVVAYPARSLGPDGPGVTCTQCGGWRLWEGAGLSGRAHWTNSITGSASQSTVTWAFGESGRYRVDAFVPSLGSEVLGKATYSFSDGGATHTATIDQNARKGWVPLTTRSFNGPATVTLGDLSDVAGKKIVADAVRLVPAPILTLQRVTPETATYGNRVRLYLTLRYSNGDGVAYRYVTLHRRPVGATAWQLVRTLRTSDMGAAGEIFPAERNVEYVARFTPAPGDYLASAESAVARQYVTPRILGAFSPSATRVSGDATTLRASVSPTHAGHAVQFQRWFAGTGWKTVAYGRLDSYGRAAWSFRPTWNGACGASSTQQYRVYKPADHDHVAGASGPLPLVVRARC